MTDIKLTFHSFNNWTGDGVGKEYKKESEEEKTAQNWLSLELRPKAKAVPHIGTRSPMPQR